MGHGGDDIVVTDGAGQFEVRVGDSASPVGAGDDLVLDVLREWGPPQDGRLAVGKEDASHACFGGVTGA